MQSGGASAHTSSCDRCQAWWGLHRDLFAVLGGVPGIITFATALAAMNNRYELEYFFGSTNVQCEMNTIGSLSAIVCGLGGVYGAVEAICRGKPCNGSIYEQYDRVRPEQNPRLVSGYVLSVAKCMATLIFMCQDFSLIMGYSNEDDDCTTYVDGAAYYSSSYSYSTHDTSYTSPCLLTSMDAVTQYKDECVAAGGDATFDCDFEPPGIWSATVAFVSIQMVLELAVLFSLCGTWRANPPDYMKRPEERGQAGVPVHGPAVVISTGSVFGAVAAGVATGGPQVTVVKAVNANPLAASASAPAPSAVATGPQVTVVKAVNANPLAASASAPAPSAVVTPSEPEFAPMGVAAAQGEAPKPVPEQLAELHQLKKCGAITQEEYEVAKRRILRMEDMATTEPAIVTAVEAGIADSGQSGQAAEALPKGGYV